MTMVYAPGRMVPFKSVDEGESWLYDGRFYSSRIGVNIPDETKVFVQPREMANLIARQVRGYSIQTTSAAKNIDISTGINS